MVVTMRPMCVKKFTAPTHPRFGTVEDTTPGRDTMDLFDIDDAQRMSREEAAAKLHTLADA